MSQVALPPESGKGIIPSDELESIRKPRRDARSTAFTAAIILGTLLAAIVTYFLLPTTGENGMTELQRRTVAIFIIACVFWATEVIPLFATSLCVIGLQILFLASKGGLADPSISDLTFQTFLIPFSNPVIILFLGGLLIASAVEKHGLDRAIAIKLLRPMFARPTLLMMGVLLLSAFFSMWLSNTATTAMMLAIIAPIINKSELDRKFTAGLILAVPFGANIGGIGTPIGTPPNAVALAALRKAGYDISFLDWMMLAVPLMILGLLLVGIVLYVLFRPPATAKIPEIKPPDRINFRGKLTLGIAGLSVVLWLTGAWHGVDEAVVALIAAALLCALGVLGRSDVDSLDWNVLLLMWGGLSLGAAMQQTGLVNWLVNQPIGQLQGIWLGGLFILLGVVLGTFMSHTAATNLLVPVAIAFGAVTAPTDGSAPGLQQGMLVILAALASSFAMAMPVSTPPNALAFATGNIRAKPMIIAGTIISVVGSLLLLAGYQIMIPLLVRAPAAPTVTP